MVRLFFLLFINMALMGCDQSPSKKEDPETQALNHNVNKFYEESEYFDKAVEANNLEIASAALLNMIKYTGRARENSLTHDDRELKIVEKKLAQSVESIAYRQNRIPKAIFKKINDKYENFFINKYQVRFSAFEPFNSINELLSFTKTLNSQFSNNAILLPWGNYLPNKTMYQFSKLVSLEEGMVAFLYQGFHRENISYFLEDFSISLDIKDEKFFNKKEYLEIYKKIL